jgi:hypothetical protein
MNSRIHRTFPAVLVALLLLSGLPSALLPVATAEDAGQGPWDVPTRIDNGKHSGMSISSVRLVPGPEGNLVASWMDERNNGTDTYTTYSNDGGETWSRDLRTDPYDNQVRITPTTCDVEVDGEGFVYSTYTQWMLQQGWWRVRFARSDDGGASFRAPSDVFFAVDDTLAQEHPATVVSSHGALNILFLERTPTTSKLFLVRSDDGLNPNPPRIIEPGMPENQAHVQGDLAMDGDNNLYIAFGYRAPGEAGVKVAKMASGSGTFDVTKVFTISEDAPRSLRPTLAVHGSVVEVVFDPLQTDGRILHVRSEDGGASWGAASKVWSGGGASGPQTHPDVAFDSLGRVHIAWAQGDAGSTRVRHSLSHDGTTFIAPTHLTGGWNESDMGPRAWEDFPAIVPTDDGGVIAAFAASLNRTVGVYFTRMDNSAPVVDITAPSEGDQVRGTVYVQGTAADPGGTTGLEAVYVQVGDGTPKRLPGTTEWEHSFDSTQYADGWINVTAWASDGFVEGERVQISVDVDNNVPPNINVAKPVNDTTYVGIVPVVGTAEDEEGFGDDTVVQWRLTGEEEWTYFVDWVLQTDHILDFDFDLDLMYLPTGPASIDVRVSDGDKFSAVETRSFELENKPDLVIEDNWVSIDIQEPEHRDIVTISVTVKNLGAGASGKYDVEFRRFNNFEGLTTGRNLSVGQEDTLTFVWEAVKGENTLIFTVDPQFKVPELDKENNEARITVKVKAPPVEETQGTNWMFIIAVVVVVAVIALAGVVMYLKYWSTAPALEDPDVQVVYESSGSIYSEGSAEYTGADTSGRDLMDGTDGADAPGLESQDSAQLTQDVEVRPEKVDKA